MGRCNRFSGIIITNYACEAKIWSARNAQGTRNAQCTQHDVHSTRALGRAHRGCAALGVHAIVHGIHLFRRCTLGVCFVASSERSSTCTSRCVSGLCASGRPARARKACVLLGMDVFIWKACASLRALRGVQARAPSRAPPSVLLGWAYLHGGNMRAVLVMG